MCMECQGWTHEESLAQLRGLMDQHGWTVVSVGPGDGEPGFAYTAGLSRSGQPELLVSAMGPEDSAAVLNHVGGLVRSGPRLSGGERLHPPGWHPLRLLPVLEPERLVCAQELLGAPGAPVPALQVVWADHDGRWPWDRSLRWRRSTQRLFCDVPRGVAPAPQLRPR